MTLSIDCIADLHGFYPELAAGDVLIVAGDLTARDRLEEYGLLQTWLDKQNYRCKVVIAGNHDGLIEKGLVAIRDDPSQHVHYLCDSGCEFEGLKIWGSPYTPTFLSWYFMRDRGQAIKKHWDLIPSDITLLVTHGPPFGILDETEEGIHVGCEELRKAVQDRIKPKFHCFGHIHEWGGSTRVIGETTYVNCSYVDERYRPVNKPVRLDYRT